MYFYKIFYFYKETKGCNSWNDVVEKVKTIQGKSFLWVGGEIKNKILRSGRERERERVRERKNGKFRAMAGEGVDRTVQRNGNGSRLRRRHHLRTCLLLRARSSPWRPRIPPCSYLFSLIFNLSILCDYYLNFRLITFNFFHTSHTHILENWYDHLYSCFLLQCKWQFFNPCFSPQNAQILDSWKQFQIFSLKLRFSWMGFSQGLNSVVKHDVFGYYRLSFCCPSIQVTDYWFYYSWPKGVGWLKRLGLRQCGQRDS